MMESCNTRGLMLHVFEQDDGWHWAITVERMRGVGKMVIAFSWPMFGSEAQARTDGMRSLALTREDRLTGARKTGVTASGEQCAAPPA